MDFQRKEELDAIRISNQERRKMQPLHNEKIVNVVVAEDAATIVLSRCYGNEPDQGMRILMLGVKYPDVGDGIMWKITSETFVPMPHTFTSRKGQITRTIHHASGPRH